MHQNHPALWGGGIFLKIFWGHFPSYAIIELDNFRHHLKSSFYYVSENVFLCEQFIRPQREKWPFTSVKKPGLLAGGNALTISAVSEMRRKKSKRGFLWSAQRNASKNEKLFNLKRNASKNNFETFCVFLREMRQKNWTVLMGYFWGGQKWPQPANKKSKTDIYGVKEYFSLW